MPRATGRTQHNRAWPRTGAHGGGPGCGSIVPFACAVPAPQVRGRARSGGGFTLVELLVVVAIIALLLGILLPALGRARQLARTTKCLSNVRNMQVAHQMYMSAHNGAFIQVGLAHSGAHADEEVAWINTLAEYYGSDLLHRSPVDDSPHWPSDEGGDGVPVPGTTDQYRRSSYGVNDMVTGLGPAGFSATREAELQSATSETVQFLIMAFTGSFAGADHVHAANWAAVNSPEAIALQASGQCQTNAHGGPAGSPEAISNYGFIDGHAETLPLIDVFESIEDNRFVARRP